MFLVLKIGKRILVMEKEARVLPLFTPQMELVLESRFKLRVTNTLILVWGTIRALRKVKTMLSELCWVHKKNHFQQEVS